MKLVTKGCLWLLPDLTSDIFKTNETAFRVYLMLLGYSVCFMWLLFFPSQTLNDL